MTAHTLGEHNACLTYPHTNRRLPMTAPVCRYTSTSTSCTGTGTSCTGTGTSCTGSPPPWGRLGSLLRGLKDAFSLCPLRRAGLGVDHCRLPAARPGWPRGHGQHNMDSHNNSFSCFYDRKVLVGCIHIHIYCLLVIIWNWLLR